MESLFINAGLAAGAALAAVPVILHLFFRQTPKHVVFPALRLIRERQKQSRKRLKIKNWLLLLARMALIALMALALARPRFNATASLGDREVPTGMALVFDTSLSMGYKERDRTRLEEAKERARSLLKRTHEASRIFVLDSAEPIAPAALSPAGALKRLDGLAIHAVNRPLNAAVQQANKAVADLDLPRREVYVFTDLARTSWDLGQPMAPAEAKAKAKSKTKAAEDAPEVPVYLVRLSPAQARNAAVVEARPMGEFAAAGEPILVRALVRSSGPALTRTVEFFVDGVKRDQKTVTLPANGETAVEFAGPRLSPGILQGEIRLGGEPDPLEADDRRFFTVEVQPPLKVLVVTDQPIDGDFVVEALDPAVLRRTGNRPFPVDRLDASRLVGNPTPLGSYAAVFVLNVARLPDQAWGLLHRYVREGGGLVLALGDRVDASAWNQQAAALLPAKIEGLEDQSRVEFTFGTADVAHPLFQRNTKDLLAELSRVPIYRYRKAVTNPGSRALLSYQNGDPALLERVFPGTRNGRTLLWTTALSRRPGNTPAERLANWTDFPMPTVGWSFFYLMNESVPYLAGTTGRALTFEAGEDVALPIDPTKRTDEYVIQGPGTEPARVGQPATGAGLLIPAPPLVGQWKVTATAKGGPSEILGFSINTPRAESQLAVLTEPEQVSLFGGKERFALVDDPEKIESVVTRRRVGRELFPALMAVILVIVTLENLLANTFYREKAARSGALGST